MGDCLMTSRIGAETRARITRAWPDILAKIAAGALVGPTITAAGFSRQMVSAYLLDEPGARATWDEARESSADAFMDQALETANSKTDDSAHARTKIDTLKWAARIRNPRYYGERSTVDMNVRTVDLTRIISDAAARLEQQRTLGRIVEGEVLRAALPASIEALL